MNNLTVIFQEMLEPGTIERVGLDHDDPSVCVTRLCSELRSLEDDNEELRAALRRIAGHYWSPAESAKIAGRALELIGQLNES